MNGGWEEISSCYDDTTIDLERKKEVKNSIVFFDLYCLEHIM
jgi:hypothetical protein